MEHPNSFVPDADTTASGNEQIDKAHQSARATAADHHVGLRIRERRMTLGFSQTQLAGMIGVTYQQMHKYERGLNRISAGRLFDTGRALDVPVGWFFEGLGGGGEKLDLSPRRRMCLEMVRNFVSIEDPQHQEALSQMARTLAAEERSIV